MNDWLNSCIPTASEPKSCVAGATVKAAGAAPVPDSATCAMSAAGSVAVRAADCAPDAVGAKVTSTVHRPADARGLPEQPSLDSANCAAFAPPSATETLPVAVAPLLVSVSVAADEVAPGAVVPKLRGGTENTRL